MCPSFLHLFGGSRVAGSLRLVVIVLELDLYFSLLPFVFPCRIFGSRNRGFDLGAVWPVLVAALGGDRARALNEALRFSFSKEI